MQVIPVTVSYSAVEGVTMTRETVTLHKADHVETLTKFLQENTAQTGACSRLLFLSEGGEEVEVDVSLLLISGFVRRLVESVPSRPDSAVRVSLAGVTAAAVAGLVRLASSSWSSQDAWSHQQLQLFRLLEIPVGEPQLLQEQTYSSLHNDSEEEGNIEEVTEIIAVESGDRNSREEPHQGYRRSLFNELKERKEKCSKNTTEESIEFKAVQKDSVKKAIFIVIFLN